MTTPDLVELHRCLAALVNPQCHFDMQAYPELERQVEIVMILDLIEEQLEAQQRTNFGGFYDVRDT